MRIPESLRQLFDFVSNHGEPVIRFVAVSCSCGFDISVQGEKVGLFCDIADEVNNLTDIFHLFVEFLYSFHSGIDSFLGLIDALNSVVSSLFTSLCNVCCLS